MSKFTTLRLPSSLIDKLLDLDVVVGFVVVVVVSHLIQIWKGIRTKSNVCK